MYVVVYDITNSKRLRKVAKILEAVGIRAQNSTFELKVDNSEIDILLKSLENICEDEDKIFCYKTEIEKKEEIRKKTSFWEMIF